MKSSTIECFAKSDFYKDILQVWFDFISTSPLSFQELLQEPLYYNDTLQIGGSFISKEFDDWRNAGIELVNDLFSENKTLLTRTELEHKFEINIPHLKYYKITSSIKAVLKEIPKIVSNVKEQKIQKLCLSDLQKIKSHQVYCQYVQSLYQTPTSQNKWVEYYPFLEQINWKSV